MAVRFFRLCVVVAFSSALVEIADAQSELGKIVPQLTGAEDQFGFSLAMSGDQLFVGALQGGRTRHADSGAVFVYSLRGDRWIETQRLTPNKPTDGERFGASVAVRPTLAIVGASRSSRQKPNGGAAYVFAKRGGEWKQTAELRPSNPQVNGMFGFSVAMTDRSAVVGAYRSGDDVRESGSVYVFERDAGGWKQTARLRPDSGVAEDWFGRSVAADGDTIAVGVTGDDTAGTDAGAVYVFERAADGWESVAKLIASDGKPNDRFGRSVAIDGAYLIVGAFWNDQAGDDAGAAYLFQRDGGRWKQQTKLIAVNAQPNDYFGISVDIDDPFAIVGAMNQDQSGEDAGAAYVIKRVGDTWRQPFRFTSSDPAAHDWFGYAVTIAPPFAAVGSIRDDDQGFDSGSVDLYRLTDAPAK
jgi:FG-GAP repeat